MLSLEKKLELYLSGRMEKAVRIQSMIPLTGGACQDNYLLKLSEDPGELVFRTDKGASLFASLSRIEECQVAELAHSFGVNTPKTFYLEKDPSYIGSPFYFMEKIEGKAGGRYVIKDPSLNRIRKTFPEVLAANLAKIHSITPVDCPDEELKKKLLRSLDPKSPNPALSAVKELRIQMEGFKEAHPAMELILNWLEKNPAETDALVLVHGDFRTGNFMVTPEKVTGIMDWEFAHFGDRHEDFAWLCMRDWRFGKVKKEVGGFADREEFIEWYEKFAEAKMDRKKILYWEVMGNLRWAIGCVGQAERHLSGKDKGIELASIGRRTCEMEMEAMRLIENAG